VLAPVCLLRWPHLRFANGIAVERLHACPYTRAHSHSTWRGVHGRVPLVNPPGFLTAMLSGQEHCGYRKAQQPAGLRLEMKEYQLQTLAWMIDHEALPHGLNQLFWEKRTFLDGGDYYYAPELGELRLEKPLERRGGILSEEMGLGKTIEILALILATKSESERVSAPIKLELAAHSDKQGRGASSVKRDPEPMAAQEEEGWAGEWGFAENNDTAVTIASKCSAAGNKVTAAQIVDMNSEALPSLTRKAKLKKGTLLRLRPSSEAGDVSTRTRKRRFPGDISSVGEGDARQGPRPQAEVDVPPPTKDACPTRPTKQTPLVAAVISQPSAQVPEAPVLLDKKKERPEVARGGTLIVVPVHLVSQWLCEIEKAAGSTLSVRKYTADNKLHKRCALVAGGPKECDGCMDGCPGPEGHMRQRIQELASSADIIVTTYAMLKVRFRLLATCAPAPQCCTLC
jgi:hypothetical protein